MTSLLLRLSIAIVISSTMSSSSYANSKWIDDKCEQESELHQYFCAVEVLRKLEGDMDRELERSLDRTASMWGPEAVLEIKDRTVETQKIWKEYRDLECTRTRYRKAPASPSHDNLVGAICMLTKTEERIREIKNQ